MEELIVDGYEFQTAEDATLARGDLQKIELLNKRLDYTKPEEVLTVYKRAIEQRIFATPIGTTYLHEIGEQLRRNPVLTEEIPPVPMSRILGNKVDKIVAEKNSKPKKNFDRHKYVVSILVNIILVIAILAMFAITLNSKNPTILNYKSKLENHYSSWEEELKERETVVREKELELRLNEKNQNNTEDGSDEEGSAEEF